jgi:hypothetical protein
MKAARTKGAKVTTGTKKDKAGIKRGLRRLSRKIAKELFTSCSGRQWPRLVFESKNGCQSGEGRSEKPSAKIIERHLLKAGGLQ